MTCTSCSGVLYLNKNTNRCVADCPDPYWNNGGNNECTLCHTRCTICGSSAEYTDCTQCAAAYFLLLSQTSCLTECPDTYWENDPGNSCDSCHSDCYTCSGAATTCTSCTGDRFLYYDPSIPDYTNSCVLAAGCHLNTYYHVLSHTCKPCSSLCATCFNALNT